MCDATLARSLNRVAVRPPINKRHVRFIRTVLDDPQRRTH